MTDNAVLRLRQFRLDRATRPFLARGCRVARCQGCLLPHKTACATPFVRSRPAAVSA